MISADISRQRLYNQGISHPLGKKPDEIVRWLVAVQAQDFAGAKWALGLRMTGATDREIEQAFNQGSILRTHILRPTWHFVDPLNIRWLMMLSAPRVHAAIATQARRLGLDQEPFTRSNDVLAKALQGGNQRTRDELREVLRQAGILVDGILPMSIIMMRAELDGILCSGPHRGKQFTYMLFDERAPRTKILEREAALGELTRRYFSSRGSATVQDFVKWSGLTVADANIGLEISKTDLQQEMISGKTYWLPVDAPGLTERPTSKAYLLSVYDELFSSYKDRFAAGDPSLSATLMKMGNDLNYIILLDGRIVGTMKRILKKDLVIIRLNYLTMINDAGREAVKIAAEKYAEFLGLKIFLE